ncbi:MAG TPA: hypothetical protein VF272_01505 [Candidatus Saccharimonadia bacterium]
MADGTALVYWCSPMDVKMICVVMDRRYDHQEEAWRYRLQPLLTKPRVHPFINLYHEVMAWENDLMRITVLKT